jgi:hypothetical protein
VAAQPSEVIEGGTWVPATTSDDHYPNILVEYTFIYAPEDLGAPRNQAQEFLLELMAVNADGIISSRVQAYVLRRVWELTLAELHALIEPSPMDNQLEKEIREHLDTSEGLEHVTIQRLAITVE